MGCVFVDMIYLSTNSKFQGPFLHVFSLQAQPPPQPGHEGWGSFHLRQVAYSPGKLTWEYGTWPDGQEGVTVCMELIIQSTKNDEKAVIHG